MLRTRVGGGLKPPPTAFRGLVWSGFFPRVDKGFRLDTEGVCHAVDIVEKADDLDGVVDAAIVKAVLAQLVDVLSG